MFMLRQLFIGYNNAQLHLHLKNSNTSGLLLFIVTQLCPTLCNPMGCNTRGFPVLHHLPEFTQIQVHLVSDAIQPSHSSVVPFSCLQSFPASGSFPVNQFLASGGQSIGVSASASILPMNIQNWFPLGLTNLISLQSKGLSRVFSSTTVQKHHFFGVQPPLWFNSHICTWLPERPLPYMDISQQSDVSSFEYTI